MEYLVLQMTGLNLTFLIEASLSPMDSILTSHAMLKHGVPKALYLDQSFSFLHFTSSTKKLNRLVNLDMTHLPVWLNGNKIYLNV